MSGTWELSNKMSIALVISNVMLVILSILMFVSMMGSKERIVLVPPHLDKAATVGWNSASEEYYKSWGLYFATLIGNITPKNVVFVTDSLSASLDASIYKSVRVKLLALAKDERFNQGTGISFFSPAGVIYEPATSKVFVTGNLTYSSGLGNTKTERPVVYEFVFEMRDGKPNVTALDSYESTEPKTLKWIEAHPAPVAAPAAPVKE